MTATASSTTTSAALVLAVVALTLAASGTAAAEQPGADDAGSGRDAGKDMATAVPIDPGTIYTAALDNGHSGWGAGSSSLVGDSDWFSFPVRGGQVINAMVARGTAPGCTALVAPDGTVLAEDGCTGSIDGVVAPVDGTYALDHGSPVADEAPYRLGVGVDAPSPLVGDLGRPSDPSTEDRQGQVIVAVADSGVNPYHEIYSRPENTAHPCTWVEGFDDCSIPALELSIGEHDTYQEAVAADRHIWESAQLHQWYWIPRTNIIGAVCDDAITADSADREFTCILDDGGHGTGTTSSVLSEAPDALLLVHDGNGEASQMPSAPVVPDIQSHSWGHRAPLPLHAVDPVVQLYGAPGFANRGAVHPETVFFIGAGNGAPYPSWTDFDRVHPAVQVVGGGYPGGWSTGSWSGYDFASWWCRPAASHVDVDAVVARFCGTSAAAPTAAGTAAAALLDIRRREGTGTRSTADMVSATVSRADFIRALRAAATYAPADPHRFPTQPTTGDGVVPLVTGQEHLLWGYGWLDRTRVDAIVACAMDGECPAKSPEAAQYNEARQQVRRTSTGDPDR